jgi:uncharacterized membrane protein HdeD (DUF308 family)
MIDELKKILIEQKKFKNTVWFIIGIILSFAGVSLLIDSFIHSKRELILIGVIAFVVGGLLIVLNKIGLNKIKRRGI